MNSYINKLLLVCMALVVVSCGDNGTKEVSAKSSRSSQYFPNMYEDVGYSTYSEGGVFTNNMEAQKPVDGTVSRGWLPYDYEDTNDGYASAKADLQNPVPLTEAHLNKGQELYGIYCAICHGNKGNGVGHLVETEKILGVPSYDAREITEGSIYHVLYYGINYMGSYASQTSIEERWEITHYVEALRADLMGVERKPLVDINTPATVTTSTDMEMTSESNNSEVTEAYPPQPNDIQKMDDNAKETQNLNTTKNDGK